MLSLLDWLLYHHVRALSMLIVWTTIILESFHTPYHAS